MKRRNALLKQTQVKRRNLLLGVALKKAPTHRELLMRQIGRLPWLMTHYENMKGRPFYVTLKGSYIVRVDGKSLYGRKARSCHVPKKIRRRRCV